MGTTFGRQIIGNFGGSIQVTADGVPAFKHGGVTVDWLSVTALAADVTFLDNVACFANEKVLRYGQVLTMEGIAEVETVTITGSPTGGTFTLTIPAVGDQPAQTTIPIAFNATAATVQAALTALSRFGPSGVVVTGSAGGPYTLTFDTRFPNLPTLTSNATLLTGGTPVITNVVTTAGGALGGMYGPYDPAATDGRQTLTKGRVFVVNETIRELDHASNHPPVIDGGRVFKSRLLATIGTHSLAAGPTFAELEAVISFRYVDD
jgi:hypothetical protein